MLRQIAAGRQSSDQRVAATAATGNAVRTRPRWPHQRIMACAAAAPPRLFLLLPTPGLLMHLLLLLRDVAATAELRKWKETAHGRRRLRAAMQAEGRVTGGVRDGGGAGEIARGRRGGACSRMFHIAGSQLNGCEARASPIELFISRVEWIQQLAG